MPYLKKLLKLIKDQNMLQKAVNDDHQKLFYEYLGKYSHFHFSETSS